MNFLCVRYELAFTVSHQRFPFIFQSEKELDETDSVSKSLLEEKSKEECLQWIKTEPSPPVLEKEPSIVDRDTVDSESRIVEPCYTPVDSQNEKCDSLPIKKEIIQEDENPSNDSNSEKIEQKVCKQENMETEETVSEQTVLSEEKNDDSSNTSKMPDLVKEHQENVPTADFNDNHNLNLLLNTIEKVTSLEQSNLKDVPQVIKSEPEEEEEAEEKAEKPTEKYSDMSKTSGLDLLSVIAGQRLVSEFDSISEKEDIKSNYPLIKQENKDTSEQAKPLCDTSSTAQKATVFEMQDRLLELQKKYKQKQKELSRLKPKKR